MHVDLPDVYCVDADGDFVFIDSNEGVVVLRSVTVIIDDLKEI